MQSIKPTGNGRGDVCHCGGKSHEELLAGLDELGNYEGEKNYDNRENYRKAENEADRTFDLAPDLTVLARKLAKKLKLKEFKWHIYDKCDRKAESQRHKNVGYVFDGTENDAEIGEYHEEEN